MRKRTSPYWTGLPSSATRAQMVPARLGLDFVHDLHGLDDADGLADGDGGADLDEIRGVRRGFPIERADHGRGDFRALGGGRGGRRRRARRRAAAAGAAAAARRAGWREGRGDRRIGAFFQLEVKVLLGEVEESEPVLIHEFDDATDFLEVHGEGRLGVG